jgi:hypothetical protein
VVFKIEHRIGIKAPVEEVYEVIADVARWPHWSPIHKKTAAKLAFGAPISLDEYYEGLGRWEVSGVISDWSPLSHIHIDVPKPFYAGSLTRFFEFERLSEAGSVFAVGAVFSGFLSEREGKRYRKYLKAGFQAMAEALKMKVESAICHI